MWRSIYHNGNFKLTTALQFETNCVGPLIITSRSAGGLRRPLFYHLATISKLGEVRLKHIDCVNGVGPWSERISENPTKQSNR